MSSPEETTTLPSETTDGECVYCKRTTTWLVTTLAVGVLRFECTHCCKIQRDVYIAQRTEEVQ